MLKSLVFLFSYLCWFDFVQNDTTVKLEKKKEWLLLLVNLSRAKDFKIYLRNNLPLKQGLKKALSPGLRMEKVIFHFQHYIEY